MYLTCPAKKFHTYFLPPQNLKRQAHLDLFRPIYLPSQFVYLPAYIFQFAKLYIYSIYIYILDYTSKDSNDF